jgi:hypothetical protein
MSSSGFWERVNMGIKYSHNLKRYEARLDVLLYLAQNWWRFCNDEGPELEEFVPNFLSEEDWCNIHSATDFIYRGEHVRRSYTLDDLLDILDWSFNPEDLKDIKIIYSISLHKWSDIKKRRVKEVTSK